MKIIPGRKSDAGFIASCVMDAVGEEICLNLAGENHTLSDVKRVFASLAEMEDTQYSYRNTLVAVDDAGEPLGAIVGYDGALLHPMREHFFAAARRSLILTWEMWMTSVTVRSSTSTLSPCFPNIAERV